MWNVVDELDRRTRLAVRRPRRLAAVAVIVTVAGSCAVALAAWRLSVGAAKRHATQSVRLLAHDVPREKRYRVTACRSIGAAKARCTYTVTVRALSGGTITCTAKVVVKGSKGKRHVLGSSFPGKPNCRRHAKGSR